MKLTLATPEKSLGKAHLKQSVKRDQIEPFKANLTRMFERIRVDEHEEHLKNIVSDFLKDTWYKHTNEINTSGRADLAIHNGTTSASSIGVLIEVKRPGNKNEMISLDRPNAKALHELLHYYMQERYIKDNKEIRHLIICNIHEWYIFDAADFERFFFGNQKLVKSYKEWKEGTLPGMGTDWFYQEIARPFIDRELDELPCVYFDLREYVEAKGVRPGSGAISKEGECHSPLHNEKKLGALYKILSPIHLLKQNFANDSNSLNREFYSELLHIIGLEEVKEKGKKLIRRKPPGGRNDGSLLENTLNFLKSRSRLSALANLQLYGADADEQYFSVALELCITWLNRLLFLKLLEGQLIGYHKGDQCYAFLSSRRIEDFDELNELFFEVLAVRVDERSSSVREKFGTIPYLNSSLFEESDLERATMRINELKNRLDLPLHAATVLKETSGKRLTGSKNTLNYLFEFLDAYDFGTEGSADIQEQNKSIINASVLGLIFEKLNGYRDGSFFTPGFITMYICRETIRRAVLRKFNDRYGWNCADITGLYNNLDKIGIREANDVVNGLKICDPAVGSGHFLVSALNEIIAVKSDLGILADADGKRLRGYDVTIENDELIVTADDRIFEYNYRDRESQRVQETLFHEKETIIENCLFGVDINPKSVAICRLRLWIELLKSTYYRQPSPPSQLERELETLPNIDINIKCGNSLVSRFAITGVANVYATERYKLKTITDRYKEKVWQYKKVPANKHILLKEIADLKESLQGFAVPTDPGLIALRKIKNNLDQMGLGMVSEEIEQYRAMVAQEENLKRQIADKKNTVYANAFEWRYEFPEVLDNEGEFTGFDVVVGNPPFGVSVQRELKAFYQTFNQQGESYVLFIEKGYDLLRAGGQFCYITPNSWLQSLTFRSIRQYVTSHYHWHNLLLLPENVFDAVVDTLVLVFEKCADGIVPSIKVAIYTRRDGNIEFSHELDWCDIPKNGDPINIVADTPAQHLYRKIISSSIQLSTLCNVFNGVKPFEKGKGTPPQTEQIMNEKPYVHTGVLPDNTWMPLLRGSLLQRYKILWDNDYWIQYGPWLAAPRDAAIFNAPQKIMVRQTGDSIIAALVAGGFIARNNLHILLPDDLTYDLRFILGLLNSRLTDFAYSHINPEKGEALAEVKKQHVEQLPIPPATETQQTPIIELVQKIISAPDSPDVPQLEAEIDRLVYALYNLTDEEIALVEGKKHQ